MIGLNKIQDHARPKESVTLSQHLSDIEYSLSLAGRRALILEEELKPESSKEHDTAGSVWRELGNLKGAIDHAESLLSEISRKTGWEEPKADLVLEYHHAMDRWFVGRSEGGQYVDYSIHHEQGDEIRRDEFFGPWSADASNSDISDDMYRSTAGHRPSLVILIRGTRYRPAGFSGFYCGYDLTRFLLVAVNDFDDDPDERPF